MYFYPMPLSRTHTWLKQGFTKWYFTLMEEGEYTSLFFLSCWLLLYSSEFYSIPPKEERHTLYWFCCLVMEHCAVWKMCSKVFVDKNYVDYVDQNNAIEHRKLDAQRVFGHGLRSCLSYSWLWKISRRRGCPGWAKGPSWDILDWKSSTPKRTEWLFGGG